MPTIKKTIDAKPRSARAGVRADATPRHGPASYVVPLVAVLGASALAAAGFVLRDRIGDLSGVAIDGLGAASKRLSPRSLLALAGVERTRSPLAIAMPGLGGLAVGLLAGAALAFWLAPARSSSAAGKVAGAASMDGVGAHDSRAAAPPAIRVPS